MPENDSTIDALSVDDAEEAGVPAGYCPHCDYRIDPGICPECGEGVEASRIRAKPRAIRRKIWIRRGVLFVIVIAAAIGGRSLHRSNVWRSWVPTSFLIAQQPSDGWTQDELMSRLKTGTMSSQEIGDFFDAAFPIELVVRSPHPLEIAPTVSRIGHRGPYSVSMSPSCNRSISPSKLIVDGNAVDEYAFGGIGGPLFGGGGSSFEVLDRSQLPVGMHLIEISGNVSYDVKSDWNAPSLPGFPITRPYHKSASLEIVDRPLRSFVDGRFDEALANKVIGSIQLVISRQDESNEFTIHAVRKAGPSIQLAGRLHLRDADDDRLLGHSNLSIPPSGGSNVYQSQSILNATERAKPMKVNVEFVPDLERAFVSGSSSYFAGRLHWHDVEVLNAPGNGYNFNPFKDGSTNCEHCRPPDSVSEWHPDDE